MQATTLSIVIPTYNRAELLCHLLTSVCADLQIWPADLELVVIDNASTDSTRAAVRGFTVAGRRLSLRCNPTNIGMDGNLAACFDAGEGKYLWQIGDDELLHRGAVSRVLDFCRHTEFGVLHLETNSFLSGEQCSEAVRMVPQTLAFEARTSRSLFRRANIYLTFISANVINRQLVRKAFAGFDPRSEMTTHLPQLAWIFAALRATDSHFYVRTPILGALTGNTSGYGLAEVFGSNLVAITRRNFTDFFPEAVRIMSNASVMRLLPRELMAQGWSSGGNKFTAEDVRTVVANTFEKNFYYRTFVRHLFSQNRASRAISFLLIRIVNKINRIAGYVFL